MRPFLMIIGLFIAVSMLGQYNVKRVKPVMKIRCDSTLIIDSLRHGYK